jgi:hypothetical protein
VDSLLSVMLCAGVMFCVDLIGVMLGLSGFVLPILFSQFMLLCLEESVGS